MLTVENLSVNYGQIRAVRGVSFTVPEGQVVTLVGANGAGKTTIMHTISGLLRPVGGRIAFAGQDITRWPAHRIVAAGIGQVAEGRAILAGMTVEENLALGATPRRPGPDVARDIAAQYERFPVLGERRRQPAGTLSGGEQQMLAIARALVARPRLLLLDEPSMGLAPLLVREIFRLIRESNAEGGRSCWSSRMRSRRWPSPTMPMCWSAARSCWKGRGPTSSATRKSNAPTSAGTSSK